jgi:hypothetical protein
MEVIKSSYTDAQKKAIKKYTEGNREKINELQRIRYKKKILKLEEEKQKEREEFEMNFKNKLILEENKEILKKKIKDIEEQKHIIYHNTIVSGIMCNRCRNYLPPMTMLEHLDITNPKNLCSNCDINKRINDSMDS